MDSESLFLRFQNQEDHKNGDYTRSCAHNQLPMCRKMKIKSGDYPGHDKKAEDGDRYKLGTSF